MSPDDDMIDDIDDIENEMTRMTRDAESRQAEEAEVSWKPVARIPDIPARDGWTHYFFRRSSRNETDTVNIQRALQEGWEFCSPADYPEFGELLRLRGDGDSTTIEFGGLVLMRMPTKRANARKEYFERRAQRQIGAVNERLNAAATDAKLNIHNRSKSVVKKSPY